MTERMLNLHKPRVLLDFENFRNEQPLENETVGVLGV